MTARSKSMDRGIVECVFQEEADGDGNRRRGGNTARCSRDDANRPRRFGHHPPRIPALTERRKQLGLRQPALCAIGNSPKPESRDSVMDRFGFGRRPSHVNGLTGN